MNEYIFVKNFSRSKLRFFIYPDLDCVKPCPKILAEVCGSDNKMYPNMCELENAKCSNPSLQLVQGECFIDSDVKPVKYISISGTVEFSPAIDQTRLLLDSCLRFEVTELILCGNGECKIPALGKHVIYNPVLTPKSNSYSYSFKFPDARNYMHRLIIRAFLNIGWCGDNGGTEQQIKEGDYSTRTVYSIIEDDFNEYTKDMKMVMYNPLPEGMFLFMFIYLYIHFSYIPSRNYS